MIGRHAALDDLPAPGANRHERRPARAIFFAQRRRDDRDYFRVLLEDEFQPLVEASRRVHLGRSRQFELDLDRRQESAELPDHVIGELAQHPNGSGIFETGMPRYC